MILPQDAVSTAEQNLQRMREELTLLRVQAAAAEQALQPLALGAAKHDGDAANELARCQSHLQALRSRMATLELALPAAEAELATARAAEGAVQRDLAAALAREQCAGMRKAAKAADEALIALESATDELFRLASEFSRTAPAAGLANVPMVLKMRRACPAAARTLAAGFSARAGIEYVNPHHRESFTDFCKRLGP